MENEQLFPIKDLDFDNLDVGAFDGDIVNSIDGNFYSILQKCYKNKGCKDFLPLIAEIDKHNIKDASILIAIMYLSDGQCGLKKDRKKAVYWAKKVFNNFGVIEIGEGLAFIYMENKQYQDAYNVYQTLSLIDNHIALVVLGDFYRYGLYVEKDLNKALDYYQQSSKQGNVCAPIKISGLYRQQGKYLKSLALLISAVRLRFKEVTKDSNSEKFRCK